MRLETMVNVWHDGRKTPRLNRVVEQRLVSSGKVNALCVGQQLLDPNVADAITRFGITERKEIVSNGMYGHWRVSGSESNAPIVILVIR